MPYVLINDLIIPSDKAFLHINDLAIQRGYGVFDFFKTINHKPIFLEDHLDRLYFSAAQMHLTLPYERDHLKVKLYQMLDQNKLPDSGVKIILTGGYADDGYTLSHPNLVITQLPLIMNGASEPAGLRLMTYSHQRQMPHIKTTDYLMAIWLQPLIQQHHADDVLYEMNGVITECPRANFFIVTKEGRIATPARNLLKGIIRKQVLKHFSSDFEIEERDILVEELYTCKEAFVTSSTKNIFPVFNVNGNIIGNGHVGTVTKQLIKRFNQLIYSF